MNNSNAAPHMEGTASERPERKNYLRGSIGAILGALLGAIPWAVALYFGWFVAWLGFVIGFCAKKGYELLGGKKGKFKVVIVCIAAIVGVLTGNTAWDLIEFGLLISSGDIVGATYSDIPALYFAWLEDPEVMRMVITNLAMGLLFAALGLFSLFKEMVRELKPAPDQELTADAASNNDTEAMAGSRSDGTESP